MFSPAWTEALRLRTLPASIIPVLCGAALALREDALIIPVTALALICALLIQTGTNLANDYYDFIRGADNADRVGFRRASASGDIDSKTVRNAAVLSFIGAFLLGLVIVFHAGWIVLLIGITSIIAGFMYTGGPYPLAYNGLGDLFVFIFFGLVAVTGTYYINTLYFHPTALISALPIGALSTMILVVNNYRDVHTDKIAGKRTLAVLLGERFTRLEYLFLMLLAFLSPLWLHLSFSFSILILLPLILAPWGLFLVYRFWSTIDKKAFNPLLVQTALFMSCFGILFIIGIASS
ncbi:1,4-dihydroxy-2-naphthoate polyprenyltransferase [Balneolaceae bacterium ANBcel3]|nr:1,4-dihydroxy-2-naphthoate polyprenyltransferase [Balneolaceae bacterium ANBcel3]